MINILAVKMMIFSIAIYAPLCASFYFIKRF